MKKWFILFLLFPLACAAQTYKNIGVEDGLSNRRVYCIQKDKQGYMWFLTHEGIDRYNGKEFTQYKLLDGFEEVNPLINLNWMYTDAVGGVWETDKKGKIFRYDPTHNTFVIAYKIPLFDNNRPNIITYSFIDSSHNIWLCNERTIFRYNIQTGETSQIANKIGKAITDVEQIDATHFFIGTEVGVHYAEVKQGTLNKIYCDKLDKINIQVNELYLDKKALKLFIGTFQRGIFIYDMNNKSCSQPELSLKDVTINAIKQFNKKEILIATDGTGVFKINIDTYQTEPYIVADYNRYNAMNGNNINDIYIDNEQRIWMANFPIGITVRNNRYSDYNWIKHSIGNQQSLINDQVNSIIEDSDGDLWFATNNGVSLYSSKTGHWQSFLSSFQGKSKFQNHIMVALCEVTPGVIWVGGYSSGIHEIRKNDLSTNYFTPSSFCNLNVKADKYIRTIKKDSQGDIWSGGYYNLKRINIANKTMRLYSGLSSITTSVEKNTAQMWIGTVNGLFLLDKESGHHVQIKLPVESTYIYSLYKDKKGLLYIGTSGSGLLIYNPITKLFTRYYSENCALISNNVYTILSDNDENIIIGTETGLVSFRPKEKTFSNWTSEQGLRSIHFNAESGTLRRNNNFVLGSADGAIEFHKDMRVPKEYSSKMIFSDFRIFYQTVYPGDKGSPLSKDINDTQELSLEYDQNIFSINVSSINYDYPSNVLYSWKLEGFYDQWSRPSSENTIRFTNLSPGNYTLHIRAVSHEDKKEVLEERTIKIHIAQSAWFSFWAILLYCTLFSLVGIIIIRIYILRKQRKVSDEKIHFFINTAHDIRTPLTLIKAPLEELLDKENFSQYGMTNMRTALRNVNALLRLTTNLINFERADVYATDLYISEHELNAYMEEMFNVFRPYAEVKRIQFTLESNFRYLNVWFDKEKMESILKNIVSNALKYTPENGSVHVFACEYEDTWSIEVKDTGIGIPAGEQKKLFKIHFRGSNAINSKVTGSGIGLILVWKLVHLHRGKIQLSSVEHQGSIVKITFPKKPTAFKKARIATKSKENFEDDIKKDDTMLAILYEGVKRVHNTNKQRLLVVEDNDELRNYLEQTLSELYNVQACCNGKEALVIVKEYKPDLVISDIMMPEMRGDELCAIIKNDLDTSHIPVILLTALNDDKNILEGLKTGADEYVVKPFNIGILKATIANLLTNRALLRNKYANLELNDENECINCSSDLDWKFIATVKKSVEENMDNQAFNVDVLCALMNMSRTSFYNKLRALTDQAPADYIRLIRLKRAAQLLRNSHHSISEVAEMTGFNDAKYFREVFKKHFKVSPSKYSKGEGEHSTKMEEDDNN